MFVLFFAFLVSLLLLLVSVLACVSRDEISPGPTVEHGTWFLFKVLTSLPEYSRFGQAPVDVNL